MPPSMLGRAAKNDVTMPETKERKEEAERQKDMEDASIKAANASRERRRKK
jgi:hypothetical protein